MPSHLRNRLPLTFSRLHALTSPQPLAPHISATACQAHLYKCMPLTSSQPHAPHSFMTACQAHLCNRMPFKSPQLHAPHISTAACPHTSICSLMPAHLHPQPCAHMPCTTGPTLRRNSSMGTLPSSKPDP